MTITNPTYRVEEQRGGGVRHVWDLPTDEATLLALVTDIFEKYWENIHFGVLVEGGAWEVAAPNAPERISMYDGYVTVDFGRWHFHLCIGEHTASGPELGRIRRAAEATMYRRVGKDGAPTSWAVELRNGEGTQIMTVMLPNPSLSDTQQILDEPDFDRLAAWDQLRATYLGLEPDPLDRSGRGFRH